MILSTLREISLIHLSVLGSGGTGGRDFFPPSFSLRMLEKGFEKENRLLSVGFSTLISASGGRIGMTSVDISCAVSDCRIGGGVINEEGRELGIVSGMLPGGSTRTGTNR